MGAIETKIFRNGDTMAVDLPGGLGFPEGTVVRIEKIDGEVRINAVREENAADQKKRIGAMLDRIEAIWGDTPRPKFDPSERMEFPDRPGLYR